MAVETIRGCGYRKIGGLYICGEFNPVPCDRLPLPLTTCPVCGGGIKVSRGFTKINPFRLWGNHDSPVEVFSDAPERLLVSGPIKLIRRNCTDRIRPCHVCDPKDVIAFIMGVGQGYYKEPSDFMEEAHRLGISKRIPFIPKELKLGKTVVYLAHPKACEVKEPVAVQQAMAIVEEAKTKQPRLLEPERNEKKLGIFCAFIPHRVEKLVWESELNDQKRKQLEKQGITPIVVPDNDLDHR